MRFRVVVADPAWRFSDRLARMKSKTKRAAEQQYRVMSVDEIASIPVRDAADPNGCVLALWVPSSLLRDGERVLDAWGFSQKGLYVWHKTKRDGTGDAMGMGRLFRQCHEVALIGTIGSPYAQLRDRSQRSVSHAPNFGHSHKPENLQDSLDVMFPGELKLELFARRPRPGWICLGDGVDGNDIRESVRHVAHV